MSRLINVFFQRIENAFPIIFPRRFPPESFALAGVEPTKWDVQSNGPVMKEYSLKDLIGDGILWAVPRNRRTIEKRWKRKFGMPEYVEKLLIPRHNIRVCNNCGHDHEVGVLCPHCYDKVRKETQLIQDKIQKELGLSPVEEDVIVIYDGEKSEQPAEFYKGKRIIEMEKPRPMWFSKNLMQKTTQQPATTKEIKPNDLG